MTIPDLLFENSNVGSDERTTILKCDGEDTARLNLAIGKQKDVGALKRSIYFLIRNVSGIELEQFFNLRVSAKIHQTVQVNRWLTRDYEFAFVLNCLWQQGRGRD